MSQGTRCHQLAMYVVYESPLQMLADSPSNYRREPESLAFLSAVPTTWDETRVLESLLRYGPRTRDGQPRGELLLVGAHISPLTSASTHIQPNPTRARKLLAAPDAESPLGLRDKAMLETLYASGLRVSELVGLKVQQVSLDMGVVRVLGTLGDRRFLDIWGLDALRWYFAPEYLHLERADKRRPTLFVGNHSVLNVFDAILFAEAAADLAG